MRSIERSPGKPGDFCARRAPGQVFDWTRGQGTSVILAETCQLVLFDPTLLSCAKKRGVEPPRRNCYFTLARKYTRVCGPLCDPMGSRYEVSNHWGKLLRFLPALSFWIAIANRFAAHSTIKLPSSELTVFRRRKAFLLCKNPCGGTAVGMGSPPQSGIAAPAQRNFQRKFALRRVGSSKFVVPPTRERSKVRNNARLVTCPCRAAPGCQRDRGPSVSGRVQRNPFQGVPLGNFFAEARHRASLRS